MAAELLALLFGAENIHDMFEELRWFFPRPHQFYWKRAGDPFENISRKKNVEIVDCSKTGFYLHHFAHLAKVLIQ